MTLAMIRRWVGTVAVGLAIPGCGGERDQAPPAPRSVEVEAKPDEGERKPELELELEVSTEELASFKLAALAITQKNAESEAAALMAEIDADIASGDDEIAK